MQTVFRIIVIVLLLIATVFSIIDVCVFDTNIPDSTLIKIMKIIMNVLFDSLVQSDNRDNLPVMKNAVYDISEMKKIVASEDFWERVTPIVKQLLHGKMEVLCESR